MSKPLNQSNKLHPPQRRIAIWLPLLIVMVLAALIVVGAWRHVQLRHARNRFSQGMSQTTVNVISVSRDEQPHSLLLPANIQAYEQTTIYARTNGYLGRWLVDIGDEVKAGQVLAQIETPEVDQELAQARATLRQLQANQELARITAQRWSEMAQKRVVAPQENDEKQSTSQVSIANTVAGQANVARLEQLQGFKTIVAPFAGTITTRRLDAGALVSAGSGTIGTVLFSLARTDPLRIYINVPQSNAASIREGIPAAVLIQELPGRQFNAKVARTAGVLDPASRTLLTEVQLPNPDRLLYAGMYAQVKFVLKDESPPIVVPANTVLFHSEGPQVAIVESDRRVRWQTIQIGRDFGTSLEVMAGLQEKELIVMNPSDDLQDRMLVEPKMTGASPPILLGAQPPSIKPVSESR
ncbi:MAG: hypothetical protein JWL59_2519 [Chthoniobacteraceae bacterium]|nr:hypothetical protein [Chthoniobacteraceae bacterium]